MNDENRQYTELLDLSNNKTTAIVKGDVGQLQEIFGKEQKLIDILNRLEMERQSCVADICKILHLSAAEVKVSQDELIISLEKHFDLELTDKAVMSKTFLELCVMGNIDCDEPDMIDFEINLAKNASMAPQTANYGKGAYEETGGMGSTSFDARQ